MEDIKLLINIKPRFVALAGRAVIDSRQWESNSSLGRKIHPKCNCQKWAKRLILFCFRQVLWLPKVGHAAKQSLSGLPVPVL
jgi:hypothetical protein